MKSKKRGTVIVSALFGVLCLAHTASAFYTPNLQRWVTRDPIEDRAPKIAPVLELYPSELENWPNTFAAMRNSPLNYYDAHGNFAIGLPVIWPIIVEGAKDLLFVCSAVITAVIVRDITKHDCDKEWADARTKCAEELAKPFPEPPYVPRRPKPGWGIEDCARGFVSEECGGNPVDWGNKPPRIRRSEIY